jgi:hypothetical protein
MTVSVPPFAALAGAAKRAGNLARAEATAERLLELPELPVLELPELLDWLLEPQAASPIDTTASSPGRNIPSNLDLDRISLPFYGRRTFVRFPLPAGRRVRAGVQAGPRPRRDRSHLIPPLCSSFPDARPAGISTGQA